MRITVRLLVPFLAVLVAFLVLAGVLLVEAGGVSPTALLIGGLALVLCGVVSWYAASRGARPIPRTPASTVPRRPAPAAAPPGSSPREHAAHAAPRVERRRMRADDPQPTDIIESADLQGANGGNGHTRHHGFEEF